MNDELIDDVGYLVEIAKLLCSFTYLSPLVSY